MSPSGFIITPGQLTRRAELYHQLSQLTIAGLPILKSLEQIARHPPSYAFRDPLNRAIRCINEGMTLTEAFRETGSWIPSFDLALLEAGEKSGRVDACFRVLSDYYTDRARMARQMISDLAYPAFLFHFAIFILPFADLFTGKINLFNYGLKTVGVLIPVYLIAVFVIYAGQGRHGEIWRSVIEKILHPIPILGSGRRELALEALINAGVSIVEAWQLAATVSGSPTLRRSVHGWKRDVLAGQTPAEAMSASGVFPDMFANQYHSGEISGKLDEVLKRMQQYYQEEGARKIHAVSQWVPRFIYLGVALMIGWKVISFYSNRFSEIEKLTDF
jgi:type IV pilus assembly protein PilC